MATLRIFSYLPNPRIWKATIAGRLTGVAVEIRGAPPEELKEWLWDFDARPLTPKDRADAGLARSPRAGFTETLYKTDAFLDAHPFGTVPAAFSPDGAIGIFESNSIMRAVARLAGPDSGLYGRGPYEASRIDSFLDAALVFGRDAQLYLFALRDRTVDAAVHGRAAAAFAAFLGGVERALAPDRPFILGDRMTLADICFAAELCLFSNERIRHAALREKGLAPIFGPSLAAQYSRATAHFAGLVRHPAFAPDMEPYLAKLEAAAGSVGSDGP